MICFNNGVAVAMDEAHPGLTVCEVSANHRLASKVKCFSALGAQAGCDAAFFDSRINRAVDN